MRRFQHTSIELTQVESAGYKQCVNAIALLACFQEVAPQRMVLFEVPDSSSIALRRLTKRLSFLA